MIRKIVSFSLYQPLFIVLGMMLFIGGGIAAFNSLPVEAFPDVTDTQVTVITLYPGRAAEEVEKQVTIPLEVALSGLPGAVRMFAHTQFGLSFIILTFDDRANGYFARQQVVERLREVDLPKGVQAQLAPFSTAIGEIYRYRMKGEGVSATDLRTYQDWTVLRQLKQVPGVADVVSLGGLIKQYEVNPDAARMRDFKVTLAQLSQAIERGNPNAGGSYVEQGRQQYLIRGIGLFQVPEDIANVVVAERNGVPVLVKDIATVNVGAVPRQGISGQDDEDDVVTGVVLMRRGENPSNVLKGVREKIDVLNSTGLPSGRQGGPDLRPHLADRQDAEDGVHQPGRRRAAGVDRAVGVPRQRARGGDRRADHPARVARHLPRALLDRHPRQPAVARRDGLRQPCCVRSLASPPMICGISACCASIIETLTMPEKIGPSTA